MSESQVSRAREKISKQKRSDCVENFFPVLDFVASGSSRVSCRLRPGSRVEPWWVRAKPEGKDLIWKKIENVRPRYLKGGLGIHGTRKYLYNRLVILHV